MSLYIGLMSGTSADGLDAALVTINSATDIKLLDALCLPYPDALRARLRTLALLPELNVTETMRIQRQLAEYAVTAVKQLLAKNKLTASDISALGSHGHTLRHQPAPAGFSWQLDDPSWIAEHTSITCVADFRRRDIAAGGEGAPLVPAFHAAVLPANSSVLNLGGIANLSLLPAQPNTNIVGFDVGPGNALLDEYCRHQLNCNYDAGGALARSGSILTDLLQRWLQEPYFQQAPPKSTGRELFRLAHLGDLSGFDSADLLATLTEFTVEPIVSALQQYAPNSTELLVCGGGVHNHYVLERLATKLNSMKVTSTLAYGVDPDWMEAMAFAWLAWRCLQRQSGNLPSVTGAVGERVLGGVYFA